MPQNTNPNEYQLRPNSLKEFVGQDKTKKSLQLFIKAAKKRKESAEHLLFYGPPGIGKTTLAHIIANELKGEIKISSGPAIERAGDSRSVIFDRMRAVVLIRTQNRT